MSFKRTWVVAGIILPLTCYTGAPGRNMCVTQPLAPAASAVKAAARDTGAMVKGKDSLQRDNECRTGKSSPRFRCVPAWTDMR